MSTYIVRVAPVEDVLVGTVEKPGGESRPFHDSGELVTILTEWEEGDRAQTGNASGSTSSSSIRET